MVAIVTTLSQLIVNPPTSNDCRNRGVMSADLGSVVKIMRARFCRKKLTANDVISNVAGLRPRTGRNAMRSVSSASTTTTVMAMMTVSGHGHDWVR